MSCFAGSVDPSTLILEEWHSDQSFYDSLTGRSPLMQLCRTVNLARAQLSLTEYSFHRIGTDTTDTKFATIDYELNPLWNPLSDFKTILDQIVSQTVALFDYQITTDCHSRRYVSESTLSNYYTEVWGKSTNRKEDWQIIINALRNVFEDLEVADIQTSAWAVLGNSSDSIVVVESLKDGYSGAGARSTRVITPTIGDPYTVQSMKFGKAGGAGYNQVTDAGGPACASSVFTGLSDISQEYVGFGWGPIWPQTTPPIYDEGTYFEAIGPVVGRDICGDGGGFVSYFGLYGWFFTTKIVRTLKIIRDPTPGDETDGVVYNWTATTEGNPEVEASVSPASGSYSWAHGETEKELTFTLELGDYSAVHDKWESMGRRIKLNIPRNRICRDFCGNETWFVD